MSSQTVKFYVERPPDQRLLEAILRPRLDGTTLEWDIGMTGSGVISGAQLSLWEHPDRFIAVVLNTKTEDPERIRGELRNPAIRLLTQAYVDNWHLALAIPRLDAWAMCDPRIKEVLEREKPASYSAISKRIEELTREQPFDATILRQRSSEYRGLEEFLHRVATTPPVTASTPWF
jgi:hypothetical protein